MNDIAIPAGNAVNNENSVTIPAKGAENTDNNPPEIDREKNFEKDGKFKKGNVVSKLGGRPKGSGISITTEIKNKLEEIPQLKNNPENKKTYLQLIIERILKEAVMGNDKMIKEIWNYIDGKPLETTKNINAEATLEQLKEALQPPE